MPLLFLILKALKLEITPFSDSLLMPSMLVKRWSFKVFFIFANRKNSHRALSDGYGGCGIITAKNVRKTMSKCVVVINPGVFSNYFTQCLLLMFWSCGKNSWCTMRKESKNTVSIIWCSSALSSLFRAGRARIPPLRRLGHRHICNSIFPYLLQPFWANLSRRWLHAVIPFVAVCDQNSTIRFKPKTFRKM